jgi:hypothetical protein
MAIQTVASPMFGGLARTPNRTQCPVGRAPTPSRRFYAPSRTPRAYSFSRDRTLSSTFMKLMYESYGDSYGLKYLCTVPSAKYFVHM